MAQNAFVLGEAGFTGLTEDATPRVVHSIPVDANKVVFVELFATAVESFWTAGAIGRAHRMFFRNEGVVLPITPQPTVTIFESSFLAPQPSVNLVTNGSKIDVTVVGKLGMTIHWNVLINWKITI